MNSGGIEQITVDQLAERLQKKEPTILVDVRQPWEHEIASIPGSQLMPLDRLMAEAEDLEIADGAMVVVYCHHGIRSLSGAMILGRMGHPKVVSLAGGIDRWSLRIDSGVPRY